jgi:hypothetical protein
VEVHCIRCYRANYIYNWICLIKSGVCNALLHLLLIIILHKVVFVLKLGSEWGLAGRFTVAGQYWSISDRRLCEHSRLSWRGGQEEDSSLWRDSNPGRTLAPAHISWLTSLGIFVHFDTVTWSRDSSFTIVIRRWAGRLVFDSRQDRIFLFVTTSRPAMGPSQPLIQWIPVFCRC